MSLSMYMPVYVSCLCVNRTRTWILGVSNLGSPLLKSMQNISNFSFISHSFRRLERESCHFLKKWINTRKNKSYWISWFFSVQQLLSYGENNMFKVGNGLILCIQEHIPSVSVTERCVAWRSFPKACKQSICDRDKCTLVCFIKWWGFLDCIWLRAEYLLMECLLPFSFFSERNSCVKGLFYLSGWRFRSLLLPLPSFPFFFCAGCNTVLWIMIEYILGIHGIITRATAIRQNTCTFYYLILQVFIFYAYWVSIEGGSMLPLQLAEVDKYYNGLFSAAEAHSVMVIQNLSISFTPDFLSLPFSHLLFQNGQYPGPEQPKR